jgi:hypothetical protein
MLVGMDILEEVLQVMLLVEVEVAQVHQEFLELDFLAEVVVEVD